MSKLDCDSSNKGYQVHSQKALRVSTDYIININTQNSQAGNLALAY